MCSSLTPMIGMLLRHSFLFPKTYFRVSPIDIEDLENGAELERREAGCAAVKVLIKGPKPTIAKPYVKPKVDGLPQPFSTPKLQFMTAITSSHIEQYQGDLLLLLIFQENFRDNKKGTSQPPSLVSLAWQNRAQLQPVFGTVGRTTCRYHQSFLFTNS